jgi:MFS family permease
VRWLFAARTVRMFSYGLLSLVLVLHLVELGLDERRIGILLTLTLVGDTAISLGLTTAADRFGRRRTLVVGAALMVLASAVFASTGSFWLLLLSAIVGVVSPSGYEVGPFLPVEQAALTEELEPARRTQVFARYHLAGTLATACGALAGGALVQGLQAAGASAGASYRAALVAYGLGGLVLLALYARVSVAVEVAPAAREAPRPALHRSRGVVLRLSGLFAVDSFAGGFVMQGMLAWWFHVRFGVAEAALGALFFATNVLGAVSALLAVRIAARIGLVNAMVFTHIPANVLLILVPLMPSLPLAILVWLLRASISQMDVPTRQSYVLAVVDPDERSAAGGVTNVARSLGAALAPALASPLLGNPAWHALPFFLAGGLKIAYDLALWRAFRALRPPEEN